MKLVQLRQETWDRALPRMIFHELSSARKFVVETIQMLEASGNKPLANVISETLVTDTAGLGRIGRLSIDAALAPAVITRLYMSELGRFRVCQCLVRGETDYFRCDTSYSTHMVLRLAHLDPFVQMAIKRTLEPYGTDEVREARYVMLSAYFVYRLIELTVGKD